MALKIWRGQVRGLSNLSEEKDIREGSMKGGLKEFVNQTMEDLLEKWSAVPEKLILKKALSFEG